MCDVIEKCRTMLSDKRIDVDALPNLELDILVAMIEGHNVVSDSISHNLIPCHPNRQDEYPPQVHSGGKSLMTFYVVGDDRMAYRLMLKHEIKLSRNRSSDYVGMYSLGCGEEDSNPNRAICKAIVAKAVAGTYKF